MATAVAAPTHGVVKKPSIKKYKAPTPPGSARPATDSQNNLVDAEENANDAPVELADRAQTNDDRPIEAEERAPSNRSSPMFKRAAPNLNGERSSVLSKAAMFENGSPFARDPTTMSIRERKALFERNKGAAIVPKAPFGQAPSAKQLLGETKADTSKPVKPLLTSTPSNSTTKSVSSASIAASAPSAPGSKCGSREELPAEGQGGIRGKLAALFNKEQTISEATIGEKFRRERQQELAMLQNRFNCKAKSPSRHNESDSESEPDPSDSAPLMGSAASLAPPAARRAELAASCRDKCRSETALHVARGRDEGDRAAVAVQPAKRRSSQDSPVVLSVLEDVKRIRVSKKEPNGVVCPEPAGLYPHLSDIETATSSAPDESDCGGSSMEDLTQERLRGRLNASENWAETSFGRDIMQAVKRSARRPEPDVSTASCSSGDSDLDDVLDEALDEVSDEGATPPKINKNHGNSLSVSFTYKGGSPAGARGAAAGFKSPLKASATPARERRADDLVHSVSFYRRMQSASSQPATPVRAVRRAPEGGGGGAPEEAERERVSTVRQRVAELQAEISKQQTVISQASQALNLCAATVEFSGSSEQAEGERLLLLATHRRQACLHEVQRLQVEGAGPAAERGAVSLALSRLSLPLRRDYIRQLNADGAVGHHCVCLLKCRDRVIATSMQLSGPAAGAVHFPDHIHMQGLASDFKVTVEVYLLQACKELLPHEVKYHISGKKSSSKLLTPKSKSSELKAPRVQSAGGPGAVRAPQFQPHGYCIFALAQAQRTTFTLNKVPHGSPLEGTVGVQVSARVSLPAPPPHAAFLTAFDDVSGLGAWHRRWCELRAPRLAWWKYPDDVKRKLPIGELDLTTVVSERVTRAPRDLCARPHTLLLETAVPGGALAPDAGSLVYHTRDDGSVVRRHLLAADTQEDREAWLDVLNRALEYARCSQPDE